MHRGPLVDDAHEWLATCFAAARCLPDLQYTTNIIPSESTIDVSKGETETNALTSMTISLPKAGHLNGAAFPNPSPDARRTIDPSCAT